MAARSASRATKVALWTTIAGLSVLASVFAIDPILTHAADVAHVRDQRPRDRLRKPPPSSTLESRFKAEVRWRWTTLDRDPSVT